MSPRVRLLALLVCALASLAPSVAVAAPVASVAATPASEDIRDIRGPIAMPNPWRWVVAGGVTLALFVAGGVAAKVMRRRRPPLTPEQRALARLEEARVLARAGQPREYAAAASDAVRAYIEERFGLGAIHATTEEFLQALVDDEGSPLGAHRQPLLQFLSACDLAKFARFELPAEGMTSLTDLARQFVIATAQPTDHQLSQPRTS
jgi:hypothetical protein